MTEPHETTAVEALLPNGSAVSFREEIEMVCGRCGIYTHYAFFIEVPDVVTGKCSEINSDSGILALCPECKDVRPLNSVGNTILFDLGIISNSEYLSWADNKNK